LFARFFKAAESFIEPEQLLYEHTSSTKAKTVSLKRKQNFNKTNKKY
jgi:hypothetical protein